MGPDGRKALLKKEDEMNLPKPSPKPSDVGGAHPHGEGCQGTTQCLCPYL